MSNAWILVVALATACGGNNADDDTGTDGGSGSGSAATSNFSFFVTSLAGLQTLAGNQLGFGGDLRYGETGAGAGLRGADKICAALAESSLAGAGSKTWRAFLSTTDTNAIDRIGNGPWYDRLGRMLSDSLADIKNARPLGGDTTIKNDFPNELGVPNHDPDGTGQVDNHDMLTGSKDDGALYAATANCLDWTANAGNKTTEGQPRVGHSWTRGIGPGGMEEGWMSTLTESGCAPGVSLIEMGPPNPNSNTVGSGGGYGGFFCFAIN